MVPDGVNTAVNAVQALGAHTSQTPTFVDAGTFELRERDDAVLVGRNSGNERVRGAIGEFPTHGGR